MTDKAVTWPFKFDGFIYYMVILMNFPWKIREVYCLYFTEESCSMQNYLSRSLIRFTKSDFKNMKDWFDFYWWIRLISSIFERILILKSRLFIYYKINQCLNNLKGIFDSLNFSQLFFIVISIIDRIIAGQSVAFITLTQKSIRTNWFKAII